MNKRRFNRESGGNLKVSRIEDYIKGWFVGDFSPVMMHSKDFEVSVKWFKQGDTEPLHKQRIATEITVVIEGKIKLGKSMFEKGDVVLIPPGEYAAFESLTDSALVCVKVPSLPNDKILG